MHDVTTRASVAGVNADGCPNHTYEETHTWKGMSQAFVSYLTQKLGEFDAFVAKEVAKKPRDAGRVTATFELTVDGRSTGTSHTGCQYALAECLDHWFAECREFAKLLKDDAKAKAAP